ncbi:hypothetical protein FALBO_5646 [Fusarium albosuccineum]|uniref:Uncharacterized protein n=1 Tax=Fusarium albosuccineum TaxID=1237068 RepID=A0A8H4LGF5_9HYPO|nr:hypothetical protein FALBO_5646 [Fusarium albosuccineum]
MSATITTGNVRPMSLLVGERSPSEGEASPAKALDRVADFLARIRRRSTVPGADPGDNVASAASPAGNFTATAVEATTGGALAFAVDIRHRSSSCRWSSGH